VIASVKRWIKIVVGFTVLAAGIAMLVLPGPGWVTIAVALAILAGEYVWARNLLDRLKEAGGRLGAKLTKDKAKDPSS
jgi:tellurite resistance protein TerC